MASAMEMMGAGCTMVCMLVAGPAKGGASAHPKNTMHTNQTQFPKLMRPLLFTLMLLMLPKLPVLVHAVLVFVLLVVLTPA